MKIFTEKITEKCTKYYFMGIQYKVKYNQNTVQDFPSSYLRLLPQNFLNLVLINIVEHCNLNCKNCCHFSSLAQEEFLDINIFEQDLKRLLELTKNRSYLIKNIQLCGGEPLLHPELIKFLEISRKYFPTSDITIVTNGILLNQQSEEFYRSCSNYNIKIAPTVYPIKVNWDAIEEKAKKYNFLINYGYVIGETRETRPENIKTSWHWPMDLLGNKDPLISFSHCNVGNNCVTHASW